MAISEMLLFAKKEDLYVRLQIQVVHIKALKMPLKKNKGRREKNAEIMKKRTKWGGGTKQNNNSHEFPISLLSFASEDFWYKEPWREKRIWIAEREVWRRGGKRERWGWGGGEGWWKSNFQQKNKLNKWDSNKLMSRSDGTGKRSFLIWPLLSISVYGDGWGEQGKHGGSVREWHDPSTGLSALAAAGLMLAGEGDGGADKVWAPAESAEPTAFHLSLEGGWRG